MNNVINKSFRVKRLLNRYYKRIKRLLKFSSRYEVFNGKSSVRFYMSTKDLLNAQRKDFGNGYFTMSDAIVRLLTVRRYLSGENEPFDLYKKMQRARIGEDWSERFEKLIKSINSSGFSYEVPIKVSRNLMIKDGSHRLALAINSGVDRIHVEMHDEIHNREYGLSYFVRNNFSLEEIECISRAQQDLLHEMEVVYTGLLWPSVADYFEDITSLLRTSAYSDVELLEFYDFEISENDLDSFVRMCYWSDDISEEKVSLKIDYIRQSAGKRLSYKMRLLRYKINDTRCKVKAISGQPQNLRSIEIKNDIRCRFREYVPNYHHDIIVHACDNSLQSEILADSLKFFFVSLEELFKDINGFRYFAVKIDTPRQHIQFPRRFLVRSDIDIYIDPLDFDRLVNVIKIKLPMLFPYKDLSYQYLYSKEGLRIRVKYDNYLLLQFDLKKKNINLTEQFFTKVFECENNISLVEGVRRLPKRFEVVFRLTEYALHRSKKWHLEYLIENIDYIDKDLLQSSFTSRMFLNRVNKILKNEVGLQ